MRKTYGEFCGLARSLDRIGGRWTLLIVRELLAGPARYRELQDGLPGVATNLLAERLRLLEDEGIVRRRIDDHGVVYELTGLGAQLEETVSALVRWGTTWMQTGPGDDAFRPRWLAVALRALLPPDGIARATTVLLRCADEPVSVSRDSNGLGITLRAAERPHATFSGTAGQILALATRSISIEEARHSGAKVEGSAAALRRALYAEAA